jgi:glycosyltransferase involved in cell wall biosynthesis
MAERVQQLYRIPSERIAIIPQPVPREATSAEVPAALSSSGVECRLLFLAQYYAHKNHAILPKVCAELRRRGLGDRVRFFLTLNPADGVAESLLAECGDLGINLGVLSRPQVYAALRGASALFLPTLVESYGLIYLEAMSCGTPILTSNRDFARWMCGDLARYFDPLNAVSIADAIESFINSGTSGLPEAGTAANLRRFPSEWSTVAGLIAEHLL